MYDNLVIIIDDEDHVLIEKKNTPKNSNYYSMNNKLDKSVTTSNTPTTKKTKLQSSKASQIKDILSRYPVSPLSIDWTHEKVLGCICVSYGLLVWIIS